MNTASAPVRAKAIPVRLSAAPRHGVKRARAAVVRADESLTGVHLSA